MPSPTATSSSSDDCLSGALARWKKSVEAELQGADFEKKLVTRTFEGVALRPLYTRADLAGLPGLDVPPGCAPFLRGVRPLGYRSHRWEIAQEIPARAPADFNAAIIADLMRGQDSEVLTPDAATRAGCPPREPGAGAGPAEGVGLSSIRDLTTALAGIDLAAIPIHVRAGADAAPLAALFLTAARAQGVGWEKLRGSVTADPLGEWLETGGLSAGLPALYDSLAGWTSWAAQHARALKTIGVNGTGWGDAGATAVQELAFALAAAAEVLRELGLRGVDPEAAAVRVRFRFAIGPQFFMEVAKFRALRPLWTRVVSAFGAPAGAAARATVHAATGRTNQTLLDPQVNMLRATTEALSAVLGGCDSLHIAPFDEVTGTSNDFSRRIARNVHTLLAEEFSFTQTADPAGGSWYVERLTDDLARQAWQLFQSIEAQGGMAAALREGIPQLLLAKAVAQKSEAVAKRRFALVGTNLFPNLKETPLVRTAGAGSGAPVASSVPGAHDAGAEKPLLPSLPPGAGWPARFEAAMVAAQAGASVEELARFTPPAATSECVIAPVAPWRAAAGFEELRTAAEALAQRTGARPRVFLARMGPPVQHKARADFSAGFFAVGGFEVLARQGFDTVAAAAEAAVKSGAGVAVLCSTDDTYPTLAPAFARAVKAANPRLIVVLAGQPTDPALAATFREAGVDACIHLRADVPATLAQFLRQMEVRA